MMLNITTSTLALLLAEARNCAATNRHREAEHLFRRSLSINPAQADVLYALGTLTYESKRLIESIEWFRRAAHVAPTSAEIHGDLGLALCDTGQYSEAVDILHKAIALRHNYYQAHFNLGHAYRGCGRVDDAVNAYRAAIQYGPPLSMMHQALIYMLYFHPDYTTNAIFREHAVWNERFASQFLPDIKPHDNDPSPERPLRVGYMSPDFANHAVGRFIAPLLASHNPASVEPICYSLVARPDDFTHRLAASVRTWRHVRDKSDPQIAELVRQDKIDIFVDLTMHMRDNRILVFARKPAPIQVTYLAYCGTTGLQTIDYRFSDSLLDPPGAEVESYSEKTCRLPRTYWCYQPSTSAAGVSTLPAAVNGYVTFGSLNNFCKVSDRLIHVWAKMLQLIPASRLLLNVPSGEPRARLANIVGSHGVDPQRLEFTGFSPLPRYFELYDRIDIALDPFPCNGGTTTCDALWKGVPVVSLCGNTAVGRAGASILANVGLPNWIANTEQDYVQIAINAARDLPALANIRTSMRNLMARSPLMDVAGFTRDVEDAYRAMWRKWCNAHDASPSQ
jgi:protein O-GlcNAc transferase